MFCTFHRLISMRSSQPLLNLQNKINQSSSPKFSLYSIFFDLQEAYPRVWRHYICNKLQEIGVRGSLPSILQSFLNNRTLIVRIQNTTSAPLTVDNGVPQGKVFSVLLFYQQSMTSQNVYNFHSPNTSSRTIITFQYVQLIRSEHI